jgi:hypothetical protein
MFELKNINTPAFIIHLSERLLKDGVPGEYGNPVWARSVFTEFGTSLSEELQKLDGVHLSYGPFAYWVRVPPVFDMIETLWSSLEAIRRVVYGDIRFWSWSGFDLYTVPEFVANPDRSQFDRMIEATLEELRRHTRY